MSNSDKDSSFDSKQENSIQIAPVPDNFEMYYNCIFNPDKPINEVEYEHRLKIITFKERNNLSHEKESFQGSSLRTNNFLKFD